MKGVVSGRKERAPGMTGLEVDEDKEYSQHHISSIFVTILPTGTFWLKQSKPSSQSWMSSGRKYLLEWSLK